MKFTLNLRFWYFKNPTAYSFRVLCPPDPRLQRSTTRFSHLPQKILDAPWNHICLHCWTTISAVGHEITDFYDFLKKLDLKHYICISSKLNLAQTRKMLKDENTAVQQSSLVSQSSPLNSESPHCSGLIHTF